MCMLVGLFVCCGDWGVLHRTLMPYQSLREKGSTVFFLRPFLPLDNLLFLSKVHPSADYSFSLPRRSGLGNRALSLGSGESTYLPTAIFARFGSQRRAMVR